MLRRVYYTPTNYNNNTITHYNHYYASDTPPHAHTQFDAILIQLSPGELLHWHKRLNCVLLDGQSEVQRHALSAEISEIGSIHGTGGYQTQCIVVSHARHCINERLYSSRSRAFAHVIALWQIVMA